MHRIITTIKAVNGPKYNTRNKVTILEIPILKPGKAIGTAMEIILSKKDNIIESAVKIPSMAIFLEVIL
jgi:hypothetical protein